MKGYHLLVGVLSGLLLFPSIVTLANNDHNSPECLVADVGETEIFGYPFLMYTFYDKTHNVVIKENLNNGTYYLKVKWTVRLYNDRIIFPIRAFCVMMLVHHDGNSTTFENEVTATLYRAAPGVSHPSVPACTNITIYSKPFTPDNVTGWYEVYLHVTVFPAIFGLGGFMDMIDIQKTIKIENT